MPKNPDYAVEFQQKMKHPIYKMMVVQTNFCVEQKTVETIKSIHGVTSVNVYTYALEVFVGKMFTFEELAPQILLVLADALGVEVEDITVTTTAALAAPQDSEWVVKVARALRPKPKLAPRNPHAPDFAATMDDVVYGKKFLCFITYPGMAARVKGFTVFEACDTFQYRTSYGASDDITAFGLTPNLSGEWAEHFSVVDTPENRRLLLQWLLEKKLDKAADELLKLYPELVQTTVIVKNGQVFTGVTLT